ncbi:MAG: hypothetical protein JWP44_1996 [Mucilaginibacter sp.]|nr:hypothetical protein [Mucilaginibacter sp.]
MNFTFIIKFLKRSLYLSFCFFVLLFSHSAKAQNTNTGSVKSIDRFAVKLEGIKAGKTSLNRNLIINATSPPFIIYPSPQTYHVGGAITPLVPVNTGGPVIGGGAGQVTTIATLNGSLNSMTGVAVDAAGNVFMADFGNNDIYEKDTNGAITIFAGNGSRGAVNGIGPSANFFEPDALVFDNAGNLYVGDSGNNLIRKITPDDVVTTLAGSGNAGSADGMGSSATFSSPRGLAADVAGNIYVADQGNNLVRKITAAGLVTTVAGNGKLTTFNTPTGVGVDAAGNLYVTEKDGNIIKKINSAGVVTIIAGNGSSGFTNGTGAAATFNYPRELRIDGSGNVYVTEQQNNDVRMITPAGVVTTLAGNGHLGMSDGIGTAATFGGPIGLAIDSKGNLYTADNWSSAIRKITLGGYTIDKTLPPGLLFDQTTGIISGTPMVAWPATYYTITANNAGGSVGAVVDITVLASAIKPSIISFPVPPLTIDANNNLIPGATSTNTETPIIYTSSNTAVATITAGGLIHIIGPGVSYITASQSGDANYADAIAVTDILTVTQYEYIVFPPIPVKNTCDADFPAGATSSVSVFPMTYTSSNPAVATISAQGIIHITGVGTTTITVSQAGDNLYVAGPPQTQILTVQAPLVPQVSIAASANSFCTGMSVTFSASATNAGINPAYQWQVNGVNAGTNSATFATTTINASDVIQCIVTADDSCKISTTSSTISGLAVSPYTTPAIAIQSSVTGMVCSGTAISFTATISNGGTSPIYQWLVNGNNAGTNSSVFTSSTLADGDIVTCMLTSQGGKCLTTLSASSNAIAVSLIPIPNPPPTLTVTASANNVYKGTPITFTASPANTVAVTGYQWHINGINAGTNSAIFTSGNINNADTVTCTITLGSGCIVSITSLPFIAVILPPPNVTIPNAFTPNGDGINDNWQIPDLAYYPHCTVEIYTRYGTMIFQSRGYSKAWDGMYNGSKLPTGTYYYVIDLNNNNSKKLSGYVAILR